MPDRRHRFDREYHPIEAAYAVRQFLELDPAFFIDKAGELGMDLWSDGKLVEFMADGGDGPTFLWHWMKISGAGKAVRQALLDRGMLLIELDAANK